MKHIEHVNLIKKAISKTRGVWADFGSGEGAFTLALRDLAGPEVEIYSVDKDKERIKQQKEAFNANFPETNIHYFDNDFTESIKLPPLDGILMANSLHYIQDHISFLASLQKYLKSGGKLVLVEYSIDEGNKWVPYPLSFKTFVKEATKVGFKDIELLEKIPSTYWEEMYSSQAIIK